MKTWDQGVAEAAEHFLTGMRIAEDMTPRELAEAAWHHGMDKTVDELENEIRAERGMPLKHAS